MKMRYWLLGAISIGLVYAVAKTYSSAQIPALISQFSQPQVKATPSPQPTPELTPQEKLHRAVNPAVVTIVENGKVIGSGCIVSPTGLVLTNKHLIDRSLEVTTKTAAGKTYSGQVVNLNLQHDLALVQLKNAEQLPTVRLANQVSVKAGDPVYAIGSPDSKAGTLTTGTFRRITPHGSLQTSPGLLKVGSSGGPLLNATGEMIGINKGILADKSGLATSAVAIKQLIDRHHAIMQSRQSQ
jgi:serine protease Do